MLRTLQDLSGGVAGFDQVIDVRSPGEFAEDHLPGAVNLPVLDDDERAEVGTIYAQSSKFDARRIGAAHIARNVAAHLEGPLRHKIGGWSPLLYCWRGGQRSQAMGLILAQVGWRTTVLQGGYRTYRRGVVARLYDQAPSLDVVLLGGPTGVGKTDLLARLAARGVQTLDLEALAAHRGSVFGEMGGQPSQKLFESRLAAALDALDATRPVVVEAESSRIGERFLPPALWGAMQAGRRIELCAPVEARVAALARAYDPVARNPDQLAELLGRLPGRHGRKRLDAWLAMARAGEIEALVAELLAEHYDPAYRRSGREGASPSLLLELEDLGQGAQEVAAKAVVDFIACGDRPGR
ncbi:tRNA 2-selenouridine(34) synthase MnmH [Caulobacter sp. S45]|uniref:tRNA 2-selenouridine(34) synthase MnmH n=1 Tax=Caulobacter sp. S45 TaxID=1641861 RepID=UPI001576EC15|nr:tRNA 2-selenouridine(34) synthase MnmH [Caulobacter sp. S45]